MPYCVPACALATIGTSTTRLARKIVTIACHQFMPVLIRPLASMYVGTHAHIATQRAVIDQTDHVRWAGVVGARSLL